ncbi:histidinol-phosphate transaminase [Shimia ponticola]|uniref:histidinol-phosphate transaminase n=1 Tax=Shimia ponticola TaxID=2582893 RepID=UPI0011BE535A|nr:histidinol-phosphate transaminase [Shimia ponticola]
MAGIEPQPGIMEIALYQGGAAGGPGADNVVKLSANENPFGPSDAAIKAVSNAAHQLHRYPEIDAASLRNKLAAKHGLDAERIVMGVGSDEILRLLAEGYAGPGTEVIYTEHGFSMYRIVALGAGATPVVVPERERIVDVDAILDGVTDATRLVFIANPANPTGTMLGLAELERLATGLPDHVILVLDGAYAEFVEGYDGGFALAEAHDNIVVTRTFSKLFGLGGMRVGWGYGPKPIMDVLNRLRNPFNLSSVAIAAAEAALDDTAHIERSLRENARLRVWLAEALAAIGVPSDTSMTNFILARFASPEIAQACDQFLQAEGVFVRPVAGYGLPNCLRITVGDEASCRRVSHVIGRFMEAHAQDAQS